MSGETPSEAIDSKIAVKLTARGAGLDDPSGLFNSSLDGNTALNALVRAAVADNLARAG